MALTLPVYFVNLVSFMQPDATEEQKNQQFLENAYWGALATMFSFYNALALARLYALKFNHYLAIVGLISGIIVLDEARTRRKEAKAKAAKTS